MASIYSINIYNIENFHNFPLFSKIEKLKLSSKFRKGRILNKFNHNNCFLLCFFLKFFFFSKILCNIPVISFKLKEYYQQQNEKKKKEGNLKSFFKESALHRFKKKILNTIIRKGKPFEGQFGFSGRLVRNFLFKYHEIGFTVLKKN